MNCAGQKIDSFGPLEKNKMGEKVNRTITCDGPECNKTITFEATEEKAKEVFANPANFWLRGNRLVKTPDGRVLVYCSDVCEIMGAKSGIHNLPEPKKIIDAGNQAAVNAAVAAANAAKASDENLKKGSGGPILVTG